MTDLEYNEFRKSLKQWANELKKDPVQIKAFLQSTGIYTPAGRLTKHYRLPKGVDPADVLTARD